MSVSIEIQHGGLRERKRIALMRRVQQVALDLFEESGFDAITVEQIAAAADTSAPTVYRHFSTKEGIVLWDEYDPTVAANIARRLSPNEPVLNAVVGGLLDGLKVVYATDATRILRRSRLVRSNEVIQSANAALLLQMKRGFAALLTRGVVGSDSLKAEVLAGAIVATLEAAIDHWVTAKGKVPLSRILRRAFAHLRNIGTA